MDRSTRTATSGVKLAVEWALDARGRCPARTFFASLSAKDRASLLISFRRLADGIRQSREHFKPIEGQGLFEFKKGQIRLIGDYRPGGRFVIAHGIDNKKQDKLPESAIAKAHRVLAENDRMETTMEGTQ
jgi:hypothetical protein